MKSKNPYGLKTRKATKLEDWRAPSETRSDPKNLFGWPRCIYLAYTPETAEKANLLCGGGDTPEEALQCAIRRIEKLGVDELNRQQLAPKISLGVKV